MSESLAGSRELLMSIITGIGEWQDLRLGSGFMDSSKEVMLSMRNSNLALKAIESHSKIKRGTNKKIYL